MSKTAMITHLMAHSTTYAKDALYWGERGQHAEARFAMGKSEAFATAASWLQEMEG
ncbi:hypothetical protein BJD46_gp84 [Mycobacterium phage Bactobuster]|uniref:Uncharacterized protein n=2 Tax=Pukovnikvirus TaxID=2948873 RepID=A0A127KQ46_9CAUD|nr:hypothetical protein Pukovnik_86 [Mycobacterium phage Pukovnik]YP_009304740.1 hypothetical protein BJD46_gp84 [Mycobacterium phage Bactobuster]ACE80012.1 hypothetical protein Pukovnik_86 [Mycobacterium phage Pukovnik]AMO44052.1 hypothetical protein SEA_BACTOBUSTER_84 [Mycobacterium phage Bactobuster]APC43237.1 hypothetical protein SEA_JAAN_90 [Mycobacterium phage Jaan]